MEAYKHLLYNNTGKHCMRKFTHDIEVKKQLTNGPASLRIVYDFLLCFLKIRACRMYILLVFLTPEKESSDYMVAQNSSLRFFWTTATNKWFIV
jgi:hypothetical protein